MLIKKYIYIFIYTKTHYNIYQVNAPLTYFNTYIYRYIYLYIYLHYQYILGIHWYTNKHAAVAAVVSSLRMYIHTSLYKHISIVYKVKRICSNTWAQQH